MADSQHIARQAAPSSLLSTIRVKPIALSGTHLRLGRLELSSAPARNSPLAISHGRSLTPPPHSSLASACLRPASL